MTKPATGAVVNDGDVALCLTAGNTQAYRINWVYLAGERLHIKGRELHIRAGKLSSTVDRPTTAIYACVGGFDHGMKYKVVIYQIASLISLNLVPQSEIYAVGQKVGCSYRSQLIDSDDVSYDITDGVEACVHLVYKNDRPKEVKCGKLTTIIPEAHFSLRDYQLVCTKHHLESTPVPLKVLCKFTQPVKCAFPPPEKS
ncbi:unnamed protein product [Dibothriocephalus latus]|uniref:Uncharacterized protein n=1 Tax=Dibothriocephalus latus TaxID=60516 RepID=A0A3P7L6V0_DIBLA|nr:unnamed protein product [Dibothriocephalus latus]